MRSDENLFFAETPFFSDGVIVEVGDAFLAVIPRAPFVPLRWLY
jgi:hypothetical protein